MASALVSREEVEARVLLGYLERLGRRLETIRQASTERNVSVIVRELKQIALTSAKHGLRELSESSATLAMEYEVAAKIDSIKLENYIAQVELARKPALRPKTLGIQSKAHWNS